MKAVMVQYHPALSPWDDPYVGFWHYCRGRLSQKWRQYPALLCSMCPDVGNPRVIEVPLS